MARFTETILTFTPTYCERHGNSLWAEPINVITSISFFIAAFFIYRLLRKRGKQRWEYTLLPILVFLVGIGSILWHTLNHPYVLLIDALPIWGVVLLLLFLVLRKMANSAGVATLLVGLFIALEIVLSVTVPIDFLGGSIRHVTAATVLFLLLIWSYWKFGKLTHWFLVALGFYVMAIVFRSVDLQVCSTLQFGTHFVWHILAPIGVYLGTRFLVEIEHRQESTNASLAS